MADLHKELRVDPLGAQPLYRQIERGIEDLIRDKGMKVGDRLPSPNAFAKTLGINERTVRHAVRRLVDRNVLVARQGRGTFIAEGAVERRVLWVCGTDFYDGDITPYLTDALRSGGEACARQGMTLEPAWLSSRRPAEVESYCREAVCRQYAGFVFISCSLKHPLSRFIRATDACYVYLSADPVLMGHPRHVVADLKGAVKLGLDCLADRGRRDIVLMCVAGYRSVYQEVADRGGLSVRILEVAETPRLSEVERRGYYAMHEALSEAGEDCGWLIMDDILARGATRALLERGVAADRRPDLVVRCGRQEIMPYGLPVTYVVNDTDREIRKAVRILADQVEGRDGGEDSYVSTYTLESCPGGPDPADESKTEIAVTT